MSNLKDSEFIAVKRSAVEYLKEKFPALCETSGLCERVAGRLYTVTKLRTAEACVPVTVSEKGEADDVLRGIRLKVASLHDKMLSDEYRTALRNEVLERIDAYLSRGQS